MRVHLNGTAVSRLWAGGYGHAGAVSSDGALMAWGWSIHGQLGGKPTVDPYLQPHTVASVAARVAAVPSGSFKSLVVHLADGTVKGVGSNAFGQIRAQVTN